MHTNLYLNRKQEIKNRIIAMKASGNLSKGKGSCGLQGAHAGTLYQQFVGRWTTEGWGRDWEGRVHKYTFEIPSKASIIDGNNLDSLNNLQRSPCE